MPEKLLKEILALKSHEITERRVLPDPLRVKWQDWEPVHTTYKRGDPAPIPGVVNIDVEKGQEREYVGAAMIEGTLARGELEGIVDVFDRHTPRLREKGFGYVVLRNLREPKRFLIHLFGDPGARDITHKPLGTPMSDAVYYTAQLRRFARAWVEGQVSP
jgi:hypothetical protein